MADKQPPPLMGATAIRPPDRVGAEKYTHILYDPKWNHLNSNTQVMGVDHSFLLYLLLMFSSILVGVHENFLNHPDSRSIGFRHSETNMDNEGQYHRGKTWYWH